MSGKRETLQYPKSPEATLRWTQGPCSHSLCPLPRPQSLDLPGSSAGVYRMVPSLCHDASQSDFFPNHLSILAVFPPYLLHTPQPHPQLLTGARCQQVIPRPPRPGIVFQSFLFSTVLSGGLQLPKRFIYPSVCAAPAHTQKLEFPRGLGKTAFSDRCQSLPTPRSGQKYLCWSGNLRSRVPAF